jgi:hypothetical protein
VAADEKPRKEHAMLNRAITHRDEFIMAQALIFALDGLRRVPEDQRPENNIDDMKAILATPRPGKRRRPVHRTGSIMSHALLGGLHHRYVRV